MQFIGPKPEFSETLLVITAGQFQDHQYHRLTEAKEMQRRISLQHLAGEKKQGECEEEEEC